MNIYLWVYSKGWTYFKEITDESKELKKRSISIGDGASIGYGASIGDGASIGNRASIGDGASIGDRASIGDGASIGYRDIWISAGPAGSRNAYTTINITQDMVYCGCLKAKTKEFIKRVRTQYTDKHSRHRIEYESIIAMIKQYQKIKDTEGE